MPSRGQLDESPGSLVLVCKHPSFLCDLFPPYTRVPAVPLPLHAKGAAPGPSCSEAVQSLPRSLAKLPLYLPLPPLRTRV